MDKRAVRQLIRDRKNVLTEDEVRSRSNNILKRLYGLDEYKNEEDIFIYLSYNQEVDTFSLMDNSIMLGKNVYAPKVLDKGIMEFYRIKDISDLESGYMGIMEPRKHCELTHINNGLFLMPGLAFDKNLNRIGYGGGYYDRYLEKDNNLIKVALCYDFQMLDEIPHNEHDLKPDIIITENKVWRK